MTTVRVENDWNGRWHRLIVDGEVQYEGHEIDDRDWLDIIKKFFGAETERIEIESGDEDW